MSDRARIGLDSTELRARLRQPTGSAQSVRVPDQRLSRLPSTHRTSDGFVRRPAVVARTPAISAPEPIIVIPPTPLEELVVAPVQVQAPTPVAPVQRWQPTLQPEPKKRRFQLPTLKGYTALQKGMVGMACCVFMIGLLVSAQTFQTNQAASAQVTAISKVVDAGPATSTAASTSTASVPSTTKPSSHSIVNYTVAPDMPRYLNITKLGVHARVLSLGSKSDGSLATPNNVYDAGWYNQSAKPGQPGAMLIDGHVSSWTTNGVFYGLKNLVPGDLLEVERGDGVKFTYKVVGSRTYDADSVNMSAAVTPVSPGKNGLNLITCTGKVKPGTSEFTQRMIVFAEQVN